MFKILNGFILFNNISLINAWCVLSDLVGLVSDDLIISQYMNSPRYKLQKPKNKRKACEMRTYVMMNRLLRRMFSWPTYFPHFHSFIKEVILTWVFIALPTIWYFVRWRHGILWRFIKPCNSWSYGNLKDHTFSDAERRTVQVFCFVWFRICFFFQYSLWKQWIAVRIFAFVLVVTTAKCTSLDPIATFLRMVDSKYLPLYKGAPGIEKLHAIR